MSRLAAALGGLSLVVSLSMSPLAASAAGKAPHVAGHPGNAQLLNTIATVEGVTPAVLQQDLAAGQTLLQIAGSKYSSADVLATALLAPEKSKLDAGVTASKITATQETTIYTKLLAAVAKLVVTPHPTLRLLYSGLSAGTHGAGAKTGTGKSGVRGIGGLGGQLTALATACNTTSANLKTAIQAGGKTILAICQATNSAVTQASLVAALTAALKTKLDAAVSANKLTAAQESTVLTKEQASLNKWVTTTIPAGGPKHH